MAWLAASFLRRHAGKSPASAADLGSRLHTQPYRDRERLSAQGRAGARRQACARNRGLRSLVAGRLSMRPGPILAASAALALAACDRGAPEPEPVATDIPDEFAGQPQSPLPEGESAGTPMAERVATLGLLNKRNNLTQDRKSTRLNSSHVKISYAVFCL